MWVSARVSARECVSVSVSGFAGLELVSNVDIKQSVLNKQIEREERRKEGRAWTNHHWRGRGTDVWPRTLGWRPAQRENTVS